MKPIEAFKAGKLDEAIAALGDELRRNPADSKSRTFLFELLCFSGDYDRAEKHLAVLAQSGSQSDLGALLYRGALNAMKTRLEMFRDGNLPKAASQSESPAVTAGTLNGVPFETLVDADPRIGANLEVFAAGSYMIIPFSLLSSVEITPPRRLRDLLWIPAVIRTTRAFQDRELGETLLPALTPFSAKHASDAVRLGRETVWEENETGELCPVGQKMLLVDGEEMPILEVRKIEFAPVAPVV
ncbi:MAG: type VI secretion system accessory protein TagJ [Candidatus Acidiferrales bacterium]|jgi:type VI secretion system protein ImpE